MNPNKNKTFRNPYPGIRSFEEDESDLFFGREKQIDELLKIISVKRFVAITGTSGSGKSSLVKAGIIPAIQRNSSEVIKCIFRPGNSPLKNISDSISKSIRENENLNKLCATENLNERKLRESFDEYFSSIKLSEENSKIIIYIDQFEEIFRFKQNESFNDFKSDSNIFVDLIIYLVNQKILPIYIILSLRSDFLGDCTEFEGLAELINSGHYLIPKMTDIEKEKAIVGPANLSGIGISDELLERIKLDVADFEINLPVLQHALMRTWEYRMVNDVSDKPLDVEHYEAVGTVLNALSIHAEQVYGSLTTTKEKKITEKIFKSLTDLGEDNRGTRRPTKLDDIIKVTGERKEEIVEVINLFRSDANSFLMPSNATKIFAETVIDISHESIMFYWSRLQNWVNEEAESAKLYLRISAAAELYQEGKGGILKNPDLQIALKWKEENEPNFEWAKRYNPAFERTINFIDYSKKEFDNKILLAEEKQKRSLKRARGVAIFLGTATLISLLFLMISLTLRTKAEKSEKQAREEQKIAVRETKLAEIKTKEAVSHKRIAEQQKIIAEQQRLFAEEQKQYAVEQKQEAIFQKSLALIAKNDAFAARDMARNLQKSAEKLRDEAYEQKLLAEEQKLRAEISEAKTDTLRKIAIAKSLAIQAIRLFESNKKDQSLSDYDKKLPYILAYQAAYFNKKYNHNISEPDIFSALLALSDSKIVLKESNSHTDGVRDIVISEKPSGFISCGEDGQIKFFGFLNPKSFKNFNTDNYGNTGFRTLALSNKYNKLIAGDLKGDILIMNVLNPIDKPIAVKVHDDIVNKIVAKSNSSIVYSASSDGNIFSIDITNLEVKNIYKNDKKILTIALNKQENLLYASVFDGGIKIIDLDSPEKITEIKTENENVTSFLFISDNEFATGTSTGKINFYNKNIKSTSVFAHNSGITDLKYDSLHNKIISAGFDTKIKIWDIQNMNLEPVVLSSHTSWVFCVAITMNYNMLISGSKDKTIVMNKIDMKELTLDIRKKISENMKEKDWLRYVGEGIQYKTTLPE